MNIIITGASKGLGLFLTKFFTNDGHSVGMIARTADLLSDICAKINSNEKGVAYFSIADLTDSKSVDLAIQDLVKKMGGIDCLINNAGMLIRKGLADTSTEDWDRSLKMNVSAGFYCSKAIMPFFAIQQSGQIINISSISTRIPLERGISYSSGKHALNGLATSLIHEFHNKDIKISSIYPGSISAAMDDTEDWRMPPIEVYKACIFILNTSKNVFIEEIVIRPMKWPE
jgi:3-oxoacyl-[acyl-carrier protein] reductase